MYFLRTSLTSSAAAMPQFGVSGLTPATVLAASPDVALKIAGNGFASGDTVIANGTPLPATFVSPSEIDLTVPASLLTTPGNVQIAITTPAPGSQTAYLVLIIAPAGPVASVSTNFVTFDALLVGNTSAPKTVTLTNNGTAPLTVSSITATGDFSQSNNCATIVPGAICTINVVFSPTAPNDRFGMLTIYDDAPSAPQTTALMGTGADVQIAPGTTGGATANVAIGQPANYALTITPAAFTGQVSFSCTNLPLHAACTITPPTATLSAAPLNVSVTISTSQQTAMLAPASTAETTFAGLSWTGLVLLIALWPVRRVLRESRFAAASGIVVLTLCVISMTCFAFTGCGGGSSSGTTPPPTQPSALTTPAGTYTVNFVATSSSGSRAMPLTLVVH
jgi:Abnormal spindle-like microcephaly-assoc'd, ASPM-SPD-2-Hydin